MHQTTQGDQDAPNNPGYNPIKGNLGVPAGQGKFNPNRIKVEFVILLYIYILYTTLTGHVHISLTNCIFVLNIKNF